MSIFLVVDKSFDFFQAFILQVMQTVAGVKEINFCKLAVLPLSSLSYSSHYGTLLPESDRSLGFLALYHSMNGDENG